MKHLRAAVVLALLTAPGAALAQEFERVEGAVRETIPAAPFLAAAYAFIWIAVLVYVVLVVRRQGRIEAEIEELRHKLDRAG